MLNKISFYYPATSEASCTWSGQLAPRMIKNPSYSCKVFLGVSRGHASLNKISSFIIQLLVKQAVHGVVSWPLG